ncbi:hypothetical protein BGZ61DRAFT_439854 [Ilyonectria robusta]|uniref:uncharacterized protein n=1 Tax=Ilyonectria robusta TaxID=1079257 RepID=UPI001E8E9AA9|nr:uncharacterized protein BGZ61DRAFT_439854 [Ilyonectria robusta]KAH8738268.1 hypothetical protein BGZ61DRAFT_439854 [Ilyonectria robusta]
MSSLYQQFVPVLIKYLKNLGLILEKAEKFCEEKGIKPEDMITYRLIADMQGLAYQVRSCSNTSKFSVHRLGAPDIPVFEDNEETFEELQSRIKRTVEMLEKVDPELINSKLNEEFIMETKMGNFRFQSGQQYISEYIIPNFHFHLSSAYCILRTQGVPIGALDYLNDVFVKV